MRFASVEITNFRAIRRFAVHGLSDLVVVAGPNGCGKTAVLDALRLLKSTYGGYQPNEWQQWFGESQISLDRSRSDMLSLFRDNTKPILLSAEIELADEERRFLRDSAEKLLEPIVWRQVLGRDVDASTLRTPALATDLRTHGARVREETKAQAERLRVHLASGTPVQAVLQITPSLEVTVQETPILEVAFQTYDPSRLGIIDYHSSHRTYERETLGGVNLNLDSQEQQRGQYSLYNLQQKYRNIKSELAASYVRALIADHSTLDGEAAETAFDDLNSTLQELFQTFFPDKEFAGPTPEQDGSLSFPVNLSSGEQHDINELSSGEKEILYGYLRLRNSAPHNSVILLDEPELHLNPALLQGLLEFWHKHLGRALNNQFWLVTHSDTLLRQSVGNPNFSVFHMASATATAAQENQAREVLADSELEQATMDLVGDLAAYRPQAKVVILEGGGDTEFDRVIVTRLFPDVARRVNVVPGGSKNRSRDLYQILSETAAKVGEANRYFVILDRDSGLEAPPDGAHALEWDRYHIENYLLEPSVIRECTAGVMGKPIFTTDIEVLDALRGCAAALTNRLVMERMTRDVNRRLVRQLRIGGSPSEPPPVAIRQSITESHARLSEESTLLLDGDALVEMAREAEDALSRSLESDDWIREFPGRAVLGRFVGQHVKGVNYEAFRNLVLDRMVETGTQPDKMSSVLNRVLEA